jgi:chromate transporter
VLWPKGFGTELDWFSGLIGIAAGIALFRFKLGIIPVIGWCSLAGLAHTWLGQ